MQVLNPLQRGEEGLNCSSISRRAMPLTEVWKKKMDKSDFKIHEETFMKCGDGTYNGILGHQQSEPEIGEMGVEFWVEFQCFQ